MLYEVITKAFANIVKQRMNPNFLLLIGLLPIVAHAECGPDQALQTSVPNLHIPSRCSSYNFV